MNTILYVEDDPQNVAVAQLRLGRRYDLLIATDDVSACTIFKERGADLTAVLMDIELKGSVLDGLALTRLMRGKLAEDSVPLYARGVPILATPVIIVTAYVEQGEAAVQSSGADQFFPKPVDFIKLTLALATIGARRAIRTLSLPRSP